MTEGRKFYVPVRAKLLFAMSLALAWMGFSLYVGYAWILDLAEIFTLPGAWFIVAGISLVPGWANAFLISGLLMDRRPRYRLHENLPPVTVLVAAYNEEDCIAETIASIVEQDYAGEVEVIVIDDGSTDATARRVREVQRERGEQPLRHIRLLQVNPNAGKANALNTGLIQAKHEILVTVDADTLIYKNGLARLVISLIDGPPNTAAVAGTVLVRNSRTNLITSLQEWDYFLGIAVVKRIQSLFQGTLVAQGAFSAYRKSAVEEIGGWTQTVGEDIVLTWALHEGGYRVGYAENAFVFTNVPENFPQFFRQRKRWARGLIEAFKKHPGVLVRPRLITPFIYLNVLFPYLDFVFLFFLVPGIVAAVFFQWYAVVGLMTLFLLPLMLLMNTIMFIRQRRIFRMHGLQVRKNFFGLLGYVFTYQILMAPASLAGYVAELFNFQKSWETKAARYLLPWVLAIPLSLGAAAPAGAARPTLLADYRFFADSDTEVHHQLTAGFRQAPFAGHPRIEVGAAGGWLRIRDASGREEFRLLTAELRIAEGESLLHLKGRQLLGDVWSPTLGELRLAHRLHPRLYLELFGEHGLVDTPTAIRLRYHYDLLGISADGRLAEEWTLVGAVYRQSIRDGNDRIGKIARLIYSPQRFPGYHVQLRGKRLDSDFDGIGYFSPERLEEYFLLLGGTWVSPRENWVWKAQAGPGLQRIDGRDDKGIYQAEVSVRGWITPEWGIEGSALCSSSSESRDSYRFCQGGVTVLHPW